MQNPHELFDVVDDQDRVIGRAPRAEVHRTGLRHRAVHILLLNSRGELYLQKRSSTKDTFPGCLDSSASGHLDAGEEYDACAVRELREELNLVVPVADLKRQFKLPASEETGWEFVWVYRLRTDSVPVPNPAEIESGRFWSLREIQQQIEAEPGAFARSFRLVFQEFCR